MPEENVNETPAEEEIIEAEESGEAEETEAAAGKKGKKGKKEKPKRPLWWEIGSWILTLLAAVVIAMALRTCLFEFVKVDGESMNDTLAHNEIMLVGKTGFSGGWVTLPFQSPEAQEASPKFALFGNPARFEPVICRYPDRGATNFVKRVVGLPGDRVALRSGYLYVNGERQEETYINDTYRVGGNNTMAEVLVPKKGDTVTYDGEQMLVNGEAYSYAYAQVGLDGGVTVRLLHDAATLDGSLSGNCYLVKTGGASYVFTGDSWLRVTETYVRAIVDASTRATAWFRINGTARERLEGNPTVSGSVLGYSNNEQMPVLLVTEDMEEAPIKVGDYTVAEDSYFVMGDHRNSSRDSRWAGALPRTYLMGGVRRVLWPLSKWRAVE